MSIETRIRILEERAPKGYGTFDAEGRPVIQSDMDGLDWYMWALELLQSRGRKAEKEKLRAQLAASVDADNAGGRLYELVASFDAGTVD